jgi:hypothetical protein
MHMFTNWTLCPLHMPQPICVPRSFTNMLVVTKKLEMAFGVMWVLLLIGFWLNGDIRWLVACFTFFANNVLCSGYTCFFMVIMSFPLCYAIKPWQHSICTRLWFQGHKCDCGILCISWLGWHLHLWVGLYLFWRMLMLTSCNCEASKQGLASSTLPCALLFCMLH